MKKRRKRLRIDRILYCLGILVVFVYLVILGISWIINHNIFKSVKEDNLLKYNKTNLKVWTKTINYIC